MVNYPPEKYSSLTGPHTGHIYNTVAFAALNTHKCDAVHYLVFADPHPRFGLILGETDGRLCSPFSAPFGGITAIGPQRTSHYRDAVDALMEYAGGRPVEIILPPTFYAPGHIARQSAALLERGTLAWADINHHYDLTDRRPAEERMNRSARKNLNTALRAGFEFRELSTDDPANFADVYDVIRINRIYRGHPLRMSLDEILTTAPMMDARLFALTLGGKTVAAAYLHHTAPGIAQVVYWGDLPDYRHLRPMNLLTTRIFRQCADDGLRILDIGISSYHGAIDPGLCDFKESIGCTPSPRLTIKLQ